MLRLFHSSSLYSVKYINSQIIILYELKINDKICFKSKITKIIHYLKSTQNLFTFCLKIYIYNKINCKVNFQLTPHGLIGTYLLKYIVFHRLINVRKQIIYTFIMY